MHEAAITEALVEQVRSFLPGAGVLEEVRIDVGELEHLDADVMRTIWAALTADTELAGSRLAIERVALRVACRACGERYEPEDPAILLCPRCGAVSPEILSGAGVLLRSLEVEGG